MPMNNTPTTYCPLPFRAAYIDPTGIKACCRDTQWHNFSIAEWLESDKLKEIQEGILSGNMPDFCVNDCLREEREFGQSLRTEALRDYNNEVFTDTSIDFIDYRASNVCNFKCRSCQPTYSHGINQEVQKHPELKNVYGPGFNDKKITIDSTNKDWILDNIRNIKRLMFTGGEPTVMSEPKEIISYILDNNIQDISILITSNGSFTDEFWKKFTKSYSNLHWTISIDAVGKDAEIVRHGTDWDVVYNNLKWLAVNANSLDVNTVVSNLNVKRLKPLLKTISELQQISKYPSGKQGDMGLRHQFFIIQLPHYLAANNWPENEKDEILDYLSTCFDLTLDNEQTNIIRNLINSISNTKFDNNKWEQSNRFNVFIDEIRNESHFLLREFK
jgi:sulfatase maturation enzyme AslB (radical SAM superfamily)